MAFFSSDREKRLWLWVLVVVVAIYSTLRLTLALAGALRENGLLEASFVLGLLLIGVSIAMVGLKMRVGGAEIGVAVISAVIMCSTFGAINSNMLSGPRVSFAMGRDEVFFRTLGRVHSEYRTPAVAIVVQTLMGCVLVAASAVLVRVVPSLADRSIFAMLTDYVVFSASLFYVLAVAAVIRLRMIHPEWERPFRVPGYPLVPLAGVAFYGWFLWYVYLGKPFEAKVGLGLVAAGLPVYWLYHRWRVSHPRTES